MAMESMYKTFSQMNTTALTESLKGISGKLSQSNSDRRMTAEGPSAIPTGSPLKDRDPVPFTPPRFGTPTMGSPRASNNEQEKAETVMVAPEAILAPSPPTQPVPSLQADGNSEAQLPSRRGSLAKKPKADAALLAKQTKSEEYRQFFHLPPEENLIEDFNCALQKKILLQGHMYLFDRYVCFYSNIFGYEKKKVISLKDVTCIRKAKTAAVFPNAIEIVAWGKKHFFASFLSRDEAYRLLVISWSQHSGYAKLFLGNGDDNDMSTPVPPYEGSRRVSWAPPLINTGSPELPECSMPGPQRDLRPLLSDADAPSTPVPESVARSLTDKLVDSKAWEVQEIEAPEVPDTFKTILDTELATSSKEFFRFFFSDDASEFLFNFHAGRGDADIRCTPWKKDEQPGVHLRELSFRHPINFYFGPKSTFCSINQTYHVYKDNHLVISTAQSMNDIPYGDYFKVEVRWDIEDLPHRTVPSCNVRISVDVPFTKKTVWKGKIEQGAIDECRETYQAWVQEATAALQEVRGDSVAPTRFPTVPGTPRERPISINLNVSDEAVLNHLERKIPVEYEAEIRRMLKLESGSRSAEPRSVRESVYLNNSDPNSPHLSRLPSGIGVAPPPMAEHGGGVRGEKVHKEEGGFSVVGMLRNLGAKAMESEARIGRLRIGVGVLAVVLLLMLQAYFFLWMRSSDTPLAGPALGYDSSFRSSFGPSNIAGGPPPFDICGPAGCTKPDLATAEGRMVAYWEQRLRLVREDMNLLEQRLQMLSREYSQAKKQFEADASRFLKDDVGPAKHAVEQSGTQKEAEL